MSFIIKSKSIRAGLVLLCLVFLSSCVQYTLVSPGPNQVGDLSFDITQAWNKVPGGGTLSAGAESWTLDGMALNSITFWQSLSDGATLFRGNKTNPYPVYSSDMLPTEIQEWVQESLSKTLGSGNALVESLNLRPIKLDGKPAFEFELNYATESNLDYNARVVVIPSAENLRLVLFRGTAIHYFDELQADYSSFKSSLRIVAAE